MWVLYICILASSGPERCVIEQKHQALSAVDCRSTLAVAKLPERSVALCRYEEKK